MTVLPAAAHSLLSAYADTAKRADSIVGNTDELAAPGFGDVLAATMADAVDANRKSEAVSIQAVAGNADLQDVVEAVNAAEISLQTVVSIRDRMVSAYQEIMRMPI